tara:strand:- start:112 stop:294 length:183 start_codon:yes stop_codon:yes gene_type:complete
MKIVEILERTGVKTYINPDHVIKIEKCINGYVWITLSNEDDVWTSFDSCSEAINYLKNNS